MCNSDAAGLCSTASGPLACTRWCPMLRRSSSLRCPTLPCSASATGEDIMTAPSMSLCNLAGCFDGFHVARRMLHNFACSRQVILTPIYTALLKLSTCCVLQYCHIFHAAILMVGLRQEVWLVSFSYVRCMPVSDFCTGTCPGNKRQNGVFQVSAVHIPDPVLLHDVRCVVCAAFLLTCDRDCARVQRRHMPPEIMHPVARPQQHQTPMLS